jgi:hypothetical protein
MSRRESGDVTLVNVRVETVQLNGDSNRQIGPRSRALELLQDRKRDLQDSIFEVVGILSETAPDMQKAERGVRIGSIEATFGLTLTADAGVLVSRIGTEASFEIKVSIDIDDSNS